MSRDPWRRIEGEDGTKDVGRAASGERGRRAAGVTITG